MKVLIDNRVKQRTAALLEKREKFRRKNLELRRMIRQRTDAEIVMYVRANIVEGGSDTTVIFEDLSHILAIEQTTIASIRMPTVQKKKKNKDHINNCAGENNAQKNQKG